MSSVAQKPKLFIRKYALFSSCKKYRFILSRVWDDQKPMVMFIGLNPSVADAENDDPTVRRMIGFAQDWGFGGFYIVNCFPFIATCPKKLNKWYYADDYYSAMYQNHDHISETRNKCSRVVFCWGGNEMVVNQKIDQVLKNTFPDAMVFKLNADGSPKHPLYVPKITQLIPYKQ